jgi:hypothetical protein
LRHRQAGLLTGKFTRERVKRLPDDDWRKRSPDFREPQLSANLAFVEKLHPIAERNGRTVAQLAIAWVLRRPLRPFDRALRQAQDGAQDRLRSGQAEVTAAIVGAASLPDRGDGSGGGLDAFGRGHGRD